MNGQFGLTSSGQGCAKEWTGGEVEMVAKARRVIGYGGAFPPYQGLKEKINGASDFTGAFQLQPVSA